MVDGVSVATSHQAAQPTQQANPKPGAKSAEVRLADQKVEATFDFEALAEAVARVQEYSDMVSGAR